MFGKTRHKPLKRSTELVRIEPAKQPAERIMAGHAVFKLQEPAQKGLFRPGKQAHIHRTLRAAQNPTHRDHQYLMKVMKLCIAITRIVQIVPAFY